jgi:hypothetical protein
MSPIIEVKPLSIQRRRLVFGLSLLLFICAVPISVFYAIGYRFDFSGDITNIKSVGGMYVRSDTVNTLMYIDEEIVTNMRLFQKAAYIQNLDAGMHRIHVQGDFVQTWVKELPVYAYFVTEVASFNLPRVPQIRIITEWNDPDTDIGVVFDTATSTYFNFASTTEPLLFSATTSTSTLVLDPEYVYVETLFASSTEMKLALSEQIEDTTKKLFTFNVPTTSAKMINATTTKQWRDFTLFEKQGEVFISWKGDQNKVPYYYCVTYTGEKETSLQYGGQVYSALAEQFASTTSLIDSVGERVCRDTIRIDRHNQKVLWFDFFPNSTDIILMQLEDGLYAVEVDDRAWQNTQLLYPGSKFEVIQEGGRIYIHDGEYYLEVFTEIASQ